MTKLEYISKYGENAYKEHVRRCKEYRDAHKQEIAERNRQYYKDNKEYFAQYKHDNAERIAEYKKQYQQEHKQEIAEYKKQYQQEHKQEIAEYKKQYQQEHKQEIAEHNRQYQQEHKQEIAEYNRHYQNETQFGRAGMLIGAYRKSDKKYNRGECTLTHQWFIDNIFGASCFYCGCSDWHQLGADRIDNSKAHTPDNVVCSCWNCNHERQKMDFKLFVEKKKIS